MIIYITTNLINNKIYIGQDKHNNPKYYGSGLVIEKAIKKYGINNFKKEILEFCTDQDDLNNKEKYWIKFYNSIDKNIGYNISEGGQGGIICDLKKISGKNNYINRMSESDRELHLNTFRRGLNYWKSKGFNTIEEIEEWISKNWCGENHSHKKNKTEDEYIEWKKQTKIGENFIRSDLQGQERKEYYKNILGGKNNPIFRGKTDEEIEKWLNENRRGENSPNAKYEYKIITDDGKTFTTKSLKSFCKEHKYNYMVLYHLSNNPKRIPKKLEYKNWKVIKNDRNDK